MSAVLRVLLFWMHAMKLSVSRVSIRDNPNIIFILTDDWGINDVGWTNDNTDTQTPFLNNLAKTESIILSNYYTERVCTATRASFLTGRYPSRYGLQSGVLHQNQPFGLTRQVSTLSNEFKANGYKTHIIGKWHLGYQSYEYTPTYRGFDTFYGYYNGGEDYFNHRSSIHYDGDPGFPMIANDLFINDEPAVNNNYDGIYGVWWQRDEALNLLKSKVNDNNPFFFYFALQASHNPRQAPDEYNKLYENGVDSGNHDRITMKAQTSTVDDAMKDIINFIKNNGLWENTLIIFGSDNGGKKTIGDNAPYRGYKNTSWEGGVKIAGFVTGGYLNHQQKGTINSYSIHITDWYPTLLSAAGLSINYQRSTKLYSTINDIDDLKDNKWSNTEELELDGIDMWQYINNGIKNDDYFENEREILLDLNDVWCKHSSCGALKIGRYKYIRGNNIATLLPDYDGSDWDRSFALNPDAAESYCIQNKDEFYKYHNVELIINSIGCQATDKGCLFDLKLDPCEYYDLSTIYPNLLNKFQDRLDEFQDEATIPLMGENNVNELATKAMINPRMVCSNPMFWCPYQSYNDVMWEYMLFNHDNDDDDEYGKEEQVPVLNIWLYMSLWLTMCIGLFLVCKHEKGKKYAHFVNQNNRQNLHELQPLVVH